MTKFLVTYMRPRSTTQGTYACEPDTTYIVSGDTEQFPYIAPEEPLRLVVDKLARHGFYSTMLDYRGRRRWVMPSAILSVQECD